MLEMLPPPGQDVATVDDLRRELADVKVHQREVIAEALAPYVTKDDLSHYATKADLHRELRLLFTAQTVALAGVLGAAAAFFGWTRLPSRAWRPRPISSTRCASACTTTLTWPSPTCSARTDAASRPPPRTSMSRYSRTANSSASNGHA